MSQFALIESLREATADIHRQLEQGLHIAGPGAGRAHFLLYLRAVHAWQSGFEQDLWSHDWPQELEPQARSGKCAWMEQDLRDAGLVPDTASVPFRPSLGTAAERVGLAYVVEGAQLGTQVLRKRLSGSLGDWQPRWLRGYGDSTGARWKKFVEAAEGMLDSPSQWQQAADAARAAFASLAAWMVVCGAADRQAFDCAQHA